MLAEEPSNAFGDAVSWNGRRFELDYNEAVTRTDYVLGEFYWRIKTGDTAMASSYDDASETASLSCEQVADETNWTYVEDVARVFRVALNAPKPRVRIFNVSGDARTAGESADHVRNTLVPGAKITFGTHPVRRIPILSNALIRAELGWAPTYTMEQGMQEYLARLRATTG